MSDLARDLQYALRLIRKAPVLSIATIVTLAFGIGLNAGVFTVLSGLLLRPRVTVSPETFVPSSPPTRADIARMIVSSSAPPIAAGIAAGLVLTIPAAIALARVFRYTPVPLHPADPLPYAAVAAALALVAFVTMLVPAKRASAVPPSVALRTE